MLETTHHGVFVLPLVYSGVMAATLLRIVKRPIGNASIDQSTQCSEVSMLGQFEPLRIAILSPVSWPVPPEGYGPWEQVAGNLTEQLVKRGHEVTLFAAAGSKTAGKLVETVPHPFSLWPEQETKDHARLDPDTGLLTGPPNFRALEQQHIAICMEAARDGCFDVVHSHLHIHAVIFSRLIDCPMVSTLHGAAWATANHPVFDRYRDQPYVSISNAERAFKPDLNYVATVYNGINIDAFPLCEEKEDYLLFAGRLSPEKGTAEAIEIALKAGMPLRLAGMIESQYRDYYDQRIKPHVDGRNITYLGLLSQRELAPHYQHARALICPILWDEPFGLTCVEAQACGTPMIGSRRGAFPELIQSGETGFLFDTMNEAVEAVKHLDRINPNTCRTNVKTRFSAPVMAEGYEAVYRRLVAQERQGVSL